MDLAALATPFKPDEIEWRIGRSGAKDGKPWATCFAYVDARAVTHRFDEVCGVGGWRMEKPEPLISENKIVGFMVGIGVKIDSEFVTKWDVADVTDFEPIKGGMSGAVRRAAAVWGVGKYLYGLDEGFAETSVTKQNGWNYQAANQQKGIPTFWWKPPALPAWAMPPAPPKMPPQQQPKPPGSTPERSKEYGDLRAAILGFGISEDDPALSEKAAKIIAWARPGVSLTACRADRNTARIVLDELTAKQAAGRMTSEEILREALGLPDDMGVPA